VAYLGESVRAEVQGQRYSGEGGDKLMYVMYVANFAQFYTLLIEFLLNLFYIICSRRDKIQSTFLVDASRVHSLVRKLLLPSAELNILPYVIFRETQHIDETTFQQIYKLHFEAWNIFETRKGYALLQIDSNELSDSRGCVNISYIYSRLA
jgi:hypothetical protein